MSKNITFEEWEENLLNTPGFQEVAEELEPGYQVARLRIQRGLTQKQLADLVGTKQSGIARLESGNSEPSLSFLRRVVQALGGRLEVRIFGEHEEASYPPASFSSDEPISVSNWPVVDAVEWQRQIREEQGDYSNETPSEEETPDQ